MSLRYQQVLSSHTDMNHLIRLGKKSSVFIGIIIFVILNNLKDYITGYVNLYLL